MEILVPKNTFLRVGEKFSARFAKKDKTLPRDPQDVYLHIFDLAADTGVLRGVPQQHIADECKMCVRAVETFRERDARWKRGYAPHLGNWLRGRRWEDEPVERGAGSSSGACFEPVSAARTDAREKIVAAYVPPALDLPELPQHLVDTVENLCRIWPQSAPRRPVQAFFRSLLASGTAPDPDGIVSAAKAYLQDTFSPGSLVGWLRGCTA